MTRQQEPCYIGIDLGEEVALLSYFRPGMSEPETVSMVAGQERYRIPTALCKYPGQEFGPWYLVDIEQSGGPDSYSVYEDDLWNRSLKGEETQLSETYPARELLIVFLRKLFRLVPGLTERAQIKGVAVHLPKLEISQIELLGEIFRELGVERSCLAIVDDQECFCHFAMNQEMELIQNDAVLFYCQENDLECLYLSHRSRSVPTLVEMKTHQLGELPLEAEARDLTFGRLAAQIFKGRLVSSVYLVGEGLEGSWLKASVPVLCQGRRVFQGRNLYSKGACYASLWKNGEQQRDYVYFGPYQLRDNLFLQVLQGGKPRFFELAEAGTSSFEAAGSCEVLLEGESVVELWMQAPDKKEARIMSLQLTELPQRPPKTTRLRIQLVPGPSVSIRVTDLGFGSWYPTSGKVWEYGIDQ